jgi:hypothetical protein
LQSTLFAPVRGLRATGALQSGTASQLAGKPSARADLVPTVPRPARARKKAVSAQDHQ